MEPNERKEMQSSKTHLVPDSLIKTESNASKSKRWRRERSETQKDLLKKEKR